MRVRTRHLAALCLLLVLLLAACDAGGTTSSFFQGGGGNGSDAGETTGPPPRAEGICGVLTEDEVRSALGVRTVTPNLKSSTECHWLTSDIQELVITVGPADVTYGQSLPPVVASAVDDPNIKWDSWDDVGDGAYATYDRTSFGGAVAIRVWDGTRMLEMMVFRDLETRPEQAVFSDAEALAEAAVVGLQDR